MKIFYVVKKNVPLNTAQIIYEPRKQTHTHTHTREIV